MGFRVKIRFAFEHWHLVDNLSGVGVYMALLKDFLSHVVVRCPSVIILILNIVSLGCVNLYLQKSNNVLCYNHKIIVWNGFESIVSLYSFCILTLNCCARCLMQDAMYSQ